MKHLTVCAMLLGLTAVCSADDNPANLLAAAAASRAARPRQAAPVAPSAPAQSTDDKAAPVDAPKFVSEAKWLLAGYNNNEVVYTIVVTNQDSRIIRCTTEMQGFFIDNGQKQSISDRQVTTVFPNEPTQVGNWMDMDQQSGATYSVKCKAV